MNFNEFIKTARLNFGKASEALPSPLARRERGAPVSAAVLAPITDSRSIFRDDRAYNDHVGRRWDFRENDFLRNMEDVNHAIDVAKKFKKNIENEQRVRRMEQFQHDLVHYSIIPLALPAMRSRSLLRFLPPSLVAVADSLSRLTGLDTLGICYVLLGAVSIATWGRVTIKLDNHWSEAAVDMLLQVSPSGTRKSALVHALRMPFGQYCTKANEGHEDRMRQAQRERQLLGKAGSYLAHKKIADTLSNVVPMHTGEVEKIKATVHEAVAFEEKLLSDCKNTRKPVRLLVDKATPFQLAATLQEQGECQGCITAEGSMLQGKLLRTNEVANLFLRAHTQESYVYENAKKRIDLSHPALPMVNLVQPEVAAKFYSNETLNEIGATARFVPYFYKSENEGGSILRESVFDDYDENCDAKISASMADYSNVVIRLLNTYHSQDKTTPRYQVSVDPEALALIRDFERKIRHDVIPEMPEAAKPCLFKAHGQAVRFAWDIHAWMHEQPDTVPIAAQEMEQGIKLVYATFEHIRYAYDPCGLQACLHAQKILASLNNITERREQDKLLDEGIDSSTIQRRTGLKSEATNNALRLLDKHNYLAVYDDATANLKVVLHPDFFEIKRW